MHTAEAATRRRRRRRRASRACPARSVLAERSVQRGEATSTSEQPRPGVSASGSPSRRQAPSRAISTQTTSWPAASRPSRTAAPEASETSCSEERPPPSTATVSRSRGRAASRARAAPEAARAGSSRWGRRRSASSWVASASSGWSAWWASSSSRAEHADRDRHCGALARPVAPAAGLCLSTTADLRGFGCRRVARRPGVNPAASECGRGLRPRSADHVRARRLPSAPAPPPSSPCPRCAGRSRLPATARAPCPGVWSLEACCVTVPTVRPAVVERRFGGRAGLADDIGHVHRRGTAGDEHRDRAADMQPRCPPRVRSRSHAARPPSHSPVLGRGLNPAARSLLTRPFRVRPSSLASGELARTGGDEDVTRAPFFALFPEAGVSPNTTPLATFAFAVEDGTG